MRVYLYCKLNKTRINKIKITKKEIENMTIKEFRDMSQKKKIRLGYHFVDRFLDRIIENILKIFN